jgi:hypothetical protein
MGRNHRHLKNYRNCRRRHYPGSIEMVLPYQKDTPEAVAIQNSTILLGQRIALLKTDNPESPINITAKPRSPSKFLVGIDSFVKCLD